MDARTVRLGESDMTASAAEPESPFAGSVPDAAVLMRAAVDRALAVGPGFLAGDIDADTMATTMVQAVRDYADQERTGALARGAAGDAVPAFVPAASAAHAGAQAAELRSVLAELMTCGSGYLAGRCDADCVARTMTYLVGEYAAG